MKFLLKLRIWFELIIIIRKKCESQIYDKNHVNQLCPDVSLLPCIVIKRTIQIHQSKERNITTNKNKN